MLKQAIIQKYLFLLINLVVRGCVGRFCLVGGVAGLTLLSLSILPSSWVLAVLEEAIGGDTVPPKEK